MKEEKLPEGWEWKRLGEIGKIFSGSTPPTSNPDNFDGEIPWITPADLSNFDGIFIERGKRNITEKGVKSSSVQLLPKDTILFSSRAPIGYVAIAANPVTTNQGFKNLVLHKGIDPKYVFYYLKTHKREMQRYGSGTTFLEVSATRFSKIPIILPPLHTQRQIAAILEQAEATKRLRAESDDLTQRFLQSVFMEIFGDPVKNDKGWGVKKIGELCSLITDGEHATPDRVNSGIYLLSARNIQNHSIILNDVDFIDQEEYDRISKRLVPQKDDILLSCSGSVGRVTRVKQNFPFQLVRSVALLRPNFTKILPIYLEYIIDTEFMQNQINQKINQSSQANLFQGKIRILKIPLPPLHLQQEFAQIVEQVEALRESQRHSASEINLLFEGLMQKAFSGELVT